MTYDHSNAPVKVMTVRHANVLNAWTYLSRMAIETEAAHHDFFLILDEDNRCVMLTGLGKRSKENARRIAALWNACAGISTEELERIGLCGVKKMMERRL